MPGQVHEQMALDQFVNTLNHPRLQEHLLAIRPESLTEAVTAGNEFLQGSRQTQLRAKQLEVEEDTEARVMPLHEPPTMSPAALPTARGMATPSQTGNTAWHGAAYPGGGTTCSGHAYRYASIYEWTPVSRGPT